MSNAEIKYVEVLNSNREIIEVKVYLGKKLVGKIMKGKREWSYFPKGSNTYSAHPTLEAAKRELEG